MNTETDYEEVQLELDIPEPEPSKPRTKKEHAETLAAKCGLSVSLCLARIHRGWTDEKILKTPKQTKPSANSYFRNPTYVLTQHKRKK